MLLNLREYHRPAGDGSGVRRALELLARPDIRTVPLAGGTTVVASLDDSIQAVVDLQDLGLDIVRENAVHSELSIGAMVTRSALAESDDAAQYCSGILTQGARLWSGSAQRNRATIGGALVDAAANDPLVCALLACDALICLEGLNGQERIPIAEFLPKRKILLAAPALITEIRTPLPDLPLRCAVCRVGRTPADAPIVLAAVSLSVLGGRLAGAKIVLGGVADTPIRVILAEHALMDGGISDRAIAAAGTAARESVSPAGDFRGSASYRKEMAGVLVERAIDEALSQGRAA